MPINLVSRARPLFLLLYCAFGARQEKGSGLRDYLNFIVNSPTVEYTLQVTKLHIKRSLAKSLPFLNNLHYHACLQAHVVSHAIVQKITLQLYKLTLSTERRLLSAINIYFARINLYLSNNPKLVLNVSHNLQRLQPCIKIMSEIQIFKLKFTENPFIIYKNSSYPSSQKKQER